MKVPVEKNKEYIVDIIDNGFEGEGIAKVDGYTIFISGAIKGEKCKILILKVTSSHAFGKIIEIIEKAKTRKEPDCITYKRCGGCSLRHIKYETTLEMKRQAVQNLVNKTLEEKIEVEKTIGMQNPMYYRNKAQYPVGIDKNGNSIIGIFAQRTHEIIPIENCYIQSVESQIIAKAILNFIIKNNIEVYNESTKKRIYKACYCKNGL